MRSNHSNKIVNKLNQKCKSFGKQWISFLYKNTKSPFNGKVTVERLKEKGQHFWFARPFVSLSDKMVEYIVSAIYRGNSMTFYRFPI